MSDRLAVFSEGRIEQVGSPADVYERPATEFVAELRGHVERARRTGARYDPRSCASRSPPTPRRTGEEARLGTIEDVVYLGPITRYVVRARGTDRRSAY